MAKSVMHEISPYAFRTVGYPQAEGYWMWSIVVDALRRFEETGEAQLALPPEIQRPGAVVGLSVGLAVRQLALSAEEWRFANAPRASLPGYV